MATKKDETKKAGNNSKQNLFHKVLSKDDKIVV